MSTPARVPAVDGWFTLDESAPALLGGRCANCGTYVFPNNRRFCPNPSCPSETFDEAPLSHQLPALAWDVGVCGRGGPPAGRGRPLLPGHPPAPPPPPPPLPPGSVT